MVVLLLGLVLFLGVHSVRIVADGWRTRQIERLGPLAWKGGYTAVAIVGLVLIIWGYGQARLNPVVLWTPMRGMAHLAALLTWVAFVLLAAAYVPGNHLQRKLGHPMVLAVKLWALAHLLANHTLADVVLFGGFLLWAVLDFRSARRRPLPPAVAGVQPNGLRTLATVVVGSLAWAAFAFWAHAAWIGVAPLGRAAA